MASPALARSPAPAAPAPARPASPRRRPRRRPRTGGRTVRAPAAKARPNRALASRTTRRSPRGAAPRPATRHRPPSLRFAQPAVAGAALLPHAAARTAGAVRDLSDSSLIVRLTQGRAWIAVLGTLLAGIVALNVFVLSLSAGAGQTAERIDALERDNSELRAQLADRLSADRVSSDAAALGMSVPDPKDVSYLRAGKGDAARAAEALP